MGVSPLDDMTVATFRATMGVFRDPQTYPDGTVQMYLDLANKVILADRWCDYRAMGISLFVSHYLVLDQRDQRAVAIGGIPGAPYSGLQSSKSVGGVSVSYETQGALNQGAGQWNLTSYGIRFYNLMQMVGMAGTQLGGPDIIVGDTFGNPWPGVIYPR